MDKVAPDFVLDAHGEDARIKSRFRHRAGMTLIAGVLTDKNQASRTAINTAVSDSMLVKAYKCDSLDDVIRKCVGAHIALREEAEDDQQVESRGSRTRNRVPVPGALWDLEHELRAVPLKLSPKIQWLALAQRKGPDYVQQSDRNRFFTSKKPEEYFGSVVAAVARNVMAVAPNKKSRRDGSYSAIRPVELHLVKNDIFCNTDLTGVLTQVNYRTDTGVDAWNNTFNYLFPKLLACSHLTSQGYKQLHYLELWLEGLRHLRPGHAEWVRVAVRKIFDRWVWAPAAQSDKLWQTRSAGGHSSRLRHLCASNFSGDQMIAPLIVLNPGGPGHVHYGTVRQVLRRARSETPPAVRVEEQFPVFRPDPLRGHYTQEQIEMMREEEEEEAAAD